MYSAVVTVFNAYESRTTKQTLWYPHILTGVSIVTDKGQMLRQYGPDSTDAAELHVFFETVDEKDVIIEKDTGKQVLNSLGEPLLYIPPKDWKKQVNELLGNTITFKPDDFFWWGEWDGGVVNDEDYIAMRYANFYDYMNRNYDYVFRITSVGGPYTVIKHFEIRGA